MGAKTEPTVVVDLKKLAADFVNKEKQRI